MSKKLSEQTPEIPYERQKLVALQYKRNEFGLLQEFDYKFNEDGSINWKRCLNPKYIVLNKEKKDAIEQKYSTEFGALQTKIQDGNQDPEDIEDGHKLILLAGMKELAKLRGYRGVRYHNTETRHDYVATVCEIEWMPNYESFEAGLEEQRCPIFSSLADASVVNTNSFATNFLNTIAENRAFTRCVRNYLNIHIVGADEVGKTAAPGAGANEFQSESSLSPTSPLFVLATQFKRLNSDFNITWPSFAKHLEDKKGIEGAREWKTVEDVPENKAYEVLGWVKDQYEKKTEKK